MFKKLRRTLRRSLPSAGYQGKCAGRYIAKLDGHLRFGSPSAEDFNLTGTVRIVEQDHGIWVNTFAEHGQESVTIAAGCTWRPIANDQFEGFRQSLQRRIVPPKVAVVAKWSEANVSFRNAISAKSLSYLRVPFWQM